MSDTKVTVEDQLAKINMALRDIDQLLLDTINNQQFHPSAIHSFSKRKKKSFPFLRSV
jgi:hypothetical protein